MKQGLDGSYALGTRVQYLVFLLIGLMLAMSALPASAQVAGSGEGQEEAAEKPRDLFGRESPRQMAESLVRALAQQDYERVTNFFDLSGLPRARRAEGGLEYATRLQALLDAGGTLAPFLSLSSDVQGNLDDRLPPDQEKIGSLPAESGEVPLLITNAGDEAGVWKISKETLAAMPELATAEDSASYRDAAPAFLSETRIGGAPILDWVILLAAAAVLYILVRMLFAGILFLAGKWKGQQESSRLWCFVHAAASPLSLYLAVMLFIVITRNLQVAIVARQLLNRFAGAIALVALAWFLWRLIDVLSEVAANRMDHRQRRRAKAAIVFVRRAVKIIILAIAFMAALDSLGINVTTGIAALGLGGLALALGAQKTIENFVGSIAVLVDEPVRVGDFCKAGDVVGTVEDIGIRSTRIRTNDRTTVTIPNGEFSALQIENFATRDRFLFNPVLKLSRDVDADAIVRVLEGIRAELQETPAIHAGARANLAGFSDNSVDIELFSYVDAPNFDEFIILKEQLLLAFLRRIKEAGARLALPATSVRIDAAAGLEALVHPLEAARNQRPGRG